MGCCIILLMLLTICPPWWIAADIPSGATSNDVVFYLGHAFWHQIPSGLYYSCEVLRPTISIIQFVAELTMVVLLFGTAIFARKLWTPIGRMNAKQWVVIVAYCAFCCGLFFNPPWIANESDFANCYQKYRDYEFFHQSLNNVHPCMLNSGPVYPEIFSSLLVFELFVAGLGCMGVLCLVSNKTTLEPEQ